MRRKSSCSPRLSFPNLIDPRLRRWPRQGFRPAVSRLEPRTLLATVTWINPAGGHWDTPSDWSSDNVPIASDDVLIPISGITVTHSSGNDSVRSLDSQAAIVMSGGSLTFVNPSKLESSLDVSGSSALNGNLTVDGQVHVDSGTTLCGSVSLAVTGPFSWDGNGTYPSRPSTSRGRPP